MGSPRFFEIAKKKNNLKILTLFAWSPTGVYFKKCSVGVITALSWKSLKLT